MRVQLAGSLLRNMFSRSVTSALQAEVSLAMLRLQLHVLLVASVSHVGDDTFHRSALH
jgi:hypothetical protein